MTVPASRKYLASIRCIAAVEDLASVTAWGLRGRKQLQCWHFFSLEAYPSIALSAVLGGKGLDKVFATITGHDRWGAVIFGQVNHSLHFDGKCRVVGNWTGKLEAKAQFRLDTWAVFDYPPRFIAADAMFR